MQRKLLLLSILFLFLQCSKSADEILPDAEDDKNPPTEQENEPQDDSTETKVLSISVQVDGDYYTNGFEGTLFLTNKDGELLTSKKLENDVNNILEHEVEVANDYDLTYIMLNTTDTNYPVDIHTFMNIEAGTFFLKALENNTSVDSDVIINFLNTGFPLEQLNSFTNSSVNDASGSGSYELDTRPSWYSGSLYVAFVSPNDGFPRYYFEKDIDPNNSYNVNYQELPSVENEIQIGFPLGADIIRARLWGYLENNGQMEWFSVDESEKANDSYFFPEGVFDGFELSASLTFGTTSQKSYDISYFGKPQSFQYTLPDLDGSVLSSELEDFNFVTERAYGFGTAFYGYFVNETRTFYRYYIHGLGEDKVAFSNDSLIDKLFEEELNINSGNLKFAHYTMINNSALKGNYNGFIQSLIDRNTAAFPEGTLVESLRLK